MTPSPVTRNLAFALVFLAGAALLWAGLRGLVFHTRHIERGPLLLVAGFAVWFALAAVARGGAEGRP